MWNLSSVPYGISFAELKKKPVDENSECSAWIHLFSSSQPFVKIKLKLWNLKAEIGCFLFVSFPQTGRFQSGFHSIITSPFCTLLLLFFGVVFFSFLFFKKEQFSVFYFYKFHNHKVKHQIVLKRGRTVNVINYFNYSYYQC